MGTTKEWEFFTVKNCERTVKNTPLPTTKGVKNSTVLSNKVWPSLMNVKLYSFLHIHRCIYTLWRVYLFHSKLFTDDKRAKKGLFTVHSQYFTVKNCYLRGTKIQ